MLGERDVWQHVDMRGDGIADHACRLYPAGIDFHRADINAADCPDINADLYAIFYDFHWRRDERHHHTDLHIRFCTDEHWSDRHYHR